MGASVIHLDPTRSQGKEEWLTRASLLSLNKAPAAGGSGKGTNSVPSDKKKKVRKPSPPPLLRQIQIRSFFDATVLIKHDGRINFQSFVALSVKEQAVGKVGQDQWQGDRLPLA